MLLRRGTSGENRKGRPERQMLGRKELEKPLKKPLLFLQGLEASSRVQLIALSLLALELQMKSLPPGFARQGNCYLLRATIEHFLIIQLSTNKAESAACKSCQFCTDIIKRQPYSYSSCGLLLRSRPKSGGFFISSGACNINYSLKCLQSIVLQPGHSS